MLKEEAEKKWCPFARHMDGRNRGLNAPHSDCLCITDKCMAWEAGAQLPVGVCLLLVKPEVFRA